MCGRFGKRSNPELQVAQPQGRSSGSNIGKKCSLSAALTLFASVSL